MNSEGKMAEDRHKCDRRLQNQKYGGEGYGRVWSQQIKTMSFLNKVHPWPIDLPAAHIGPGRQVKSYRHEWD